MMLSGEHLNKLIAVLLPWCRLLLEDSDEEEGDLCRICQMGEEAASNPLIQPCRCTGSLQYVHQECIKRWLCSKINSGTPHFWLLLSIKMHSTKMWRQFVPLRHKPGGHHNLRTLQRETAFEYRQLWHPGVIQNTCTSESLFYLTNTYLGHMWPTCMLSKQLKEQCARSKKQAAQCARVTQMSKCLDTKHQTSIPDHMLCTPSC